MSYTEAIVIRGGRFPGKICKLRNFEKDVMNNETGWVINERR